jgi:hypothetical protein
MAPIEHSTSAGTPLATQNAAVQSIFLCRELGRLWRLGNDSRSCAQVGLLLTFVPGGFRAVVRSREDL